MMSLMKRLVFLGALLCSHSALAFTFSDSFSTNPLTSRWCERFHNVHWSNAKWWMVAWAVTACDSSGACCQPCRFD